MANDRIAGRPQIVARRAVLAGLAAVAAYGPVTAGVTQSCATVEDGDGPVFSPSGPHAERYGAADGSPVTGLLIAKDNKALFEHYQYGRTDRDQFYSG